VENLRRSPLVDFEGFKKQELTSSGKTALKLLILVTAPPTDREEIIATDAATCPEH
jgi:hypothetical protein